MHTLRRKFVSESLIRSNLWAHSCNILLRSSRKRNLADIMGTRGRVYRNGDVRGGPNISESSSVAFKLVVGSVILFGFLLSQIFFSSSLFADSLWLFVLIWNGPWYCSLTLAEYVMKFFPFLFCLSMKVLLYLWLFIAL